MHIGLQVLRAKIRGFQAAGISLHNRIRKAKGSKRDKLWNEKRRLGCYSREHLIAYGLLRGVPYWKIERCVKKNNKPDATKVFELMRTHGSWKVTWELTIDKVKKLLTPSAAPSDPSPMESLPPPAPQPERLPQRA